MKKPSPWNWLCTSRLIALLVPLFLITNPSYSQMQSSEETHGGDATRAKAPGAEQLPLRQIVLFTSGVGYFEHRGTVQGETEIEMQFEAEDIDDLLKSMVVEDEGDEGHVTAVTYSSKAPASQLLKTFAIDLAENPSLAELLRQVRGEEVEVAAPEPLEGTIVSIETQKRKVDEEVFQKNYLNLRTAEGLKSLALQSISSIRLLDPQLNEQFTRALEVLAGANDREGKTVQLRFTGQAEREVRVGYIQKSPVWKLSYRLVLRQDQPHLLQGWAIVDNPTRRDWKDVRLSLVSGRPVSYIMPLYDPLYVERPTVELDLYRSLRPQKYEQELLLEEEAEPQQAPPPEVMRQGMAQMQAAEADRGARAARRRAAAEQQADRLARGAQAVAQAGEVGQLFEYALDEPVTVPRQNAAMLPVINAGIEGERLSIYDPSVHQKHPLRGLRLSNTTDNFLMEGPITVFDEGVYAGDALLEDLQPGAERLISYALDLELEISPETDVRPRQITALRLVNGTMHIRRQQIRERTYVAKNSGDSEQKVLIEYPRDPNWELDQVEEPAARTRDSYRFTLGVPASSTEQLVVRERQTTSEQVAVTDLNRQTVLQYSSSEAISDEVRRALEEAAERMQEIQNVVEQQKKLRGRLEEIARQQERIRKNMAELEAGTQLHSRYVSRLSEQEDQIERLEEELQELQQKERELRSSLEDYLSDLMLP